MNGLDHYREAERLAEAYRDAWNDVEAMPLTSVADTERRLHAADGARLLLTKAQVHATLALVAVTAEAGLPMTRQDGAGGWNTVTTPWAEAVRS